MDGCVFCDIIAADDSTVIVAATERCVIFKPLNPVTEGHLLVVPDRHVASAAEDWGLTGHVFEIAALWASHVGARAFNLITSAGPAATQTIEHLHVHIVPRYDGDGLHLPWTGQEVRA
jgi:histidine triad (HIT) family protein